MCSNRHIPFFYKVGGLFSSSPGRIVRYPLCFPRGYQTRLSCRLSHMRGCLLQLAPEGLIFGDGVLYRFRIRPSSFLFRANVSVCLCMCLPAPHPVSLLPLPCTTVWPRRCYLACTWARARSGPDWDINCTQRLGVYFRCLRQVRIGKSRSGSGEL